MQYRQLIPDQINLSWFCGLIIEVFNNECHQAEGSCILTLVDAMLLSNFSAEKFLVYHNLTKEL